MNPDWVRVEPFLSRGSNWRMVGSMVPSPHRVYFFAASSIHLAAWFCRVFLLVSTRQYRPWERPPLAVLILLVTCQTFRSS
jgi:hypothetical protein